MFQKCYYNYIDNCESGADYIKPCFEERRFATIASRLMRARETYQYEIKLRVT